MMILRYIESLLVRQINWLRVLNRETGFISQGSTAAGPPPSHSSGCDSWRSRSCAAGICMLHSCIIQGVPSSQTWQRRLHVNTCHILRQTLFQAGENQNQWPIDSRRTWQSMAPFGWAVQSCAPSFGSSTVVSLPDAANFFFLLAPQEGGMWHNVTMDVDGCGWISSWYGRISEIVSANISNHHWFEELLCSGLRLCSEQLEGHHRSSEIKVLLQTHIYNSIIHFSTEAPWWTVWIWWKSCLPGQRWASGVLRMQGFVWCLWGQMRAEWICLRDSRGDPVANTQAACLALVYFLNLLKSSWYWVLQRYAEVHCITAATNASPNSLTALGIKEKGINS